MRPKAVSLDQILAKIDLVCFHLVICESKNLFNCRFGLVYNVVPRALCSAFQTGPVAIIPRIGTMPGFLVVNTPSQFLSHNSPRNSLRCAVPSLAAYIFSQKEWQIFQSFI